MKIVIALPTKSSNDSMLAEGIVYLNRLLLPLKASPLFISPKSEINEAHKEKRMILEGVELLAKTEGHFRIALSDKGKMFNSEQFAGYLFNLSHRTQKIAFLIGGAFGLSQDVLSKCDATLSISPMTLPHRLAFLVLCEQLYRAGEITRGGPYHK